MELTKFSKQIKRMENGKKKTKNENNKEWLVGFKQKLKLNNEHIIRVNFGILKGLYNKGLKLMI